MPCQDFRSVIIGRLRQYFVDTGYDGATYSQEDYDQMSDDKLLDFYVELYGKVDE